ncbi:transporter substrate-binding domain-containing protein [Kordiimonas sp. SCSIO 12603]|uniref:substrate-binding periplasmic protein n=1 Tax=Kordiimonas sp. SCSIO 12603 TaxID=2829596 RepID=UPI00210584F2|nr:transporter substrate-binding domain-containing protein [Kordiimonas sp. SCSIO 12603]UTW57994.1 transporter substrate-binding domain-containing protein [Kordiimonas sp. SCSIO 12603]
MRLIIAFLLSATFVSFSVWSNDQTVRLTVGNWRPFIEQKDQTAQGIAISVVEAAFKEANYSVEWGFFPWGRAYALGKIGTWDGSAVWYHSENRANDFLYSDPVFTFQEALVCHQDVQAEWQTFEDILTHRIGTVMFSEHPYIGDYLKNANKSPIRFPTYQTLYNSLISKRIDCILINPVAHTYFLDEIFPSQKITLNIASKAFPLAHTSLIISKNAENAEELIKSFNKGLQKIRNSGLYAEIINRFPYFVAENTLSK